MVQDFKITTRNRSEMVDVTEQVRSALFSSGVKTGICQVYTLHTTAGITINENADPDVRADILEALNRLVPLKNNYRHGEGNSAAHIKTTLTGSSVAIPIKEGRLVLGIWQSVFLCEFDGPRSRTVIVNSIGQ
ncbi:MAG: secondary thiamine-phosphate synthase enzyme YjbQ [Candidatus Latescibacterota bacterium]|jgi:secondary thiamine-phosphate synthase enzyme